MTAAGTADFGVVDAARAAGCSPAELRIWEARYGWPCPRRLPVSGDRLYDAALVAEIRRVVRLRDAGTPIGTILATGAPPPVVVPDEPARPRRRVDLSALAEPATAAGRAAQRMLIRAVERGHVADTVADLAEQLCARVHPDDRVLVLAVVARARQAEEPSLSTQEPSCAI